jgi:hypothetical protein
MLRRREVLRDEMKRIAMLPLSSRISSAALLILLPWILGQSQESKPDESVWFVLSEGYGKKLEVEPIGRITAGKILKVPAGCDPAEPEYKRFVSAYLQRARPIQ